MLTKAKNSFLIGLFIGATLFYFATLYPNETQSYLTGLGLLGIVLAYMEYRTRTRNKQVLSVIEQLKFFRTEVLANYEFAILEIRKIFIDYKIKTGICIEEFSVDWVQKRDSEFYKEQQKIHSVEQINHALIKLLNSAEEFSWSVILNNTIEHEALHVVHDSFVQFVENHIQLILFLRTLNKKQFEGLIKVYLVWSKETSREVK